MKFISANIFLVIHKFIGLDNKVPYGTIIKLHRCNNFQGMYKLCSMLGMVIFKECKLYSKVLLHKNLMLEKIVIWRSNVWNLGAP